LDGRRDQGRQEARFVFDQVKTQELLHNQPPLGGWFF